jgi:hypothetical protein
MTVKGSSKCKVQNAKLRSRAQVKGKVKGKVKGGDSVSNRTQSVLLNNASHYFLHGMTASPFFTLPLPPAPCSLLTLHFQLKIDNNPVELFSFNC